MKNFKKYKTIFLINWQTALESKVFFIFWTFVAILPFVMMIILWKFVYGTGTTSIQGYDLSAIITYYFLVLLINRLTNSYVEWHVGERIKDGTISVFLTQPASLMAHYNLKILGHRILFVLVFIPVFFLFYIILKDYLILPTLINFLLFLFSVSIAYVIFQYLSYLFGFIAFWVEDADGFFYMKQTLMVLFMGALFPFEFLGQRFSEVLERLPFAYLVHYPINIYLGKFSEEEVLKILVTGIIWAVIMYVSAKIVYKRGIKKYSAVGG